MEKHDLKIGKAILWVVFYFGVMLFYTLLDVAIWRTIAPTYADLLHVITISLCIAGFLVLLRKTGFHIGFYSNITPRGVLSALGCSLLFYLLLDKGLDPLLESAFPKSQQNYLDALESLRQSPAAGLIQVCILAPLIEEILMRGFVLGGLSRTYGPLLGLLISSMLFAVLHFNMVQTLSTLVCGIILGILYLKTGSIFCCILAHSGYNAISCLFLL